MQWVCQPAPLPAWLTPSTHHYCSWLAPQNLATAQNARTETAAARTTELGSQHREDKAAPGAAAHQLDTADAAQPKQQQQQGDTGLTGFHKPVISTAISNSTAQQLLNAAAEDASGAAEAPPAKRARLAIDGTAPAETVTAVSWEPILAQLQAFGETGDISQLDQQQFLQVLSAAALQHTHASTQDAQQLQQLQQQLADLSADACLVLLQELLAAFSNSSSSGINHSSATQLQPTAKVLPTPGVTFLLTHALLPKLRSLSAAAPKSLLGCLTALGHSNAHDVLVRIVLAPLVVSDGLLPVQVQLLVKLAKEADGLQPRLLDLLLLAALGHSPASNPAPRTHAAPTAVVGGSSFWREPHASLFKSLLDLAPQHVSQQLPSVVSALQAAVQHPALAKSTVFGQLLMGLLKSFAASFSKQQVEQLQQAVGCTATFLSKSLSSKLQQLQEQHAQLQS